MALWNLTDTQLSKPKYLDRGQVLVVNVTNAGSGYTAVPTATLAAPNSGTQATAVARMKVATVAVNAGGSAWTIGDTFTVDLDDTAGTIEATFVVTDVTEGAVTAAALATDGGGLYVDITPVSLTGVAAIPVSVADEDAGSLTVNLTLNIKDVILTNPGGGYVPNDLTNGVLPVTFNPNGTTAAASGIVRPYISGSSPYTDSQIVFVDREEAAIPDNRARGLRSPGWWLYSTKTDNDGTERFFSELLVAVDVPVSSAGDAADDESAAEGTIAITLASTKTIVDGATGTMVATVTSTPATSLTYQWQVYNSSWTNLTNAGVYSGVATDTLTLTAPAYDLNGKRYRLKVSATGRRTTYSNAVTLTITPVVLSFTTNLEATASGTVGGTVSLEVLGATTPSGRTINYVWESSTDGGDTWVTEADPTPNEYYFTIGILTAEDDGTMYRVTLTRSGAISVVSTVTTLTVGP